jgi:hypothetical protein
MTGLVRKAMLLTVGAMLIAGAAYASVPCASCSTLPSGVRLVGTSAGVPDAVGQFTVTVRDLANNLIPNSSVVVDFSGNGPDIRIQSTQPFAGLSTDCGTKTVRALTDAGGIATFRIVGRSTLGPGAGFLAGKIFADGVLLGNRTVAAFDLDGAGGVGAVDLSAWVGDFLAAASVGRGDYDFNGSLGAVDLSVWVGCFLGAGSTASATPLCP